MLNIYSLCVTSFLVPITSDNGYEFRQNQNWSKWKNNTTHSCVKIPSSLEFLGHFVPCGNLQNCRWKMFYEFLPNKVGRRPFVRSAPQCTVQVHSCKSAVLTESEIHLIFIPPPFQHRNKNRPIRRNLDEEFNGTLAMVGWKLVRNWWWWGCGVGRWVSVKETTVYKRNG